MTSASTRSVTIAAVVLTLNESVNVARCLSSLHWCDELVVVDSGSEDGTVALALEYGAQVYEHRSPAPFKFSDQRNWSLAHTNLRSEWVLFVDADEEVTPALARELRRRCGNENVDAYRLAPKYMFLGQWMKRCMGYPSWHDRLVRRGSVSFAGGVWEHFAGAPSIGYIEEPYMHYGNSKGFAEWLDRHRRYSSWEADGVVSYLNRSTDPFGTQRKVARRQVAARLWRLRPILRFLTMYVARGGFLDGPAAFRFCLRYLVYEYMIVEQVGERVRRNRGQEL